MFGPSQLLKILGMLYDALTKRCSLPQSKVENSISRIDVLLKVKHCTTNEVKNCWAIKFGPVMSNLRPFISALSSKIKRLSPRTIIEFGEYARMAVLLI